MYYELIKRKEEYYEKQIDQLETKLDELGKGQQTLINSRKKWKNRYYKEKRRRKEADKSVWQIYLDYQDIGNMYFNLDEKRQKLIEQLEENKELKTITNQFEAYECEAPKDSKAKIIIADKFYFNNGYFKNNFIEIDKIKRVFEDFEKIMKEGESNV